MDCFHSEVVAYLEVVKPLDNLKFVCFDNCPFCINRYYLKASLVSKFELSDTPQAIRQIAIYGRYKVHDYIFKENHYKADYRGLGIRTLRTADNYRREVRKNVRKAHGSFNKNPQKTSRIVKFVLFIKMNIKFDGVYYML